MGPTIGAYSLEGEIGRGGMGRVFRARHSATGAVRALKVLDSNADPLLVARFRREAETLARLDDEDAVKVLDTGFADGHVFFAMPLMAGGSLEARLRARGRYPWRDAVVLVATLARSLDRCHAKGLVHRDVKPGNVLFDASDHPRLADFGLVRDSGAASLTETGSTLGTPGYMAPETCKGVPAGPAADIFALGAVLHELVAGERPFAGASGMQLLRATLAGARRPMDPAIECPDALDRAIARALAPDPAARHPSARALAFELEQLLVEPAVERSLARPLLAAAGSVAVLALLVGIAVFARARRNDPGATPRDPAVATPGTRAETVADHRPLVEELKARIGRGEIKRVTEEPRVATLLPAEKKEVAEAALAESEVLALHASGLPEAVKAFELALALAPRSRARGALVAAAYKRYMDAYLAAENKRDSLDELGIVIVGLRAEEPLDSMSRARLARRAAVLSRGLLEKNVLELDQAVAYMDAVIDAVPEHPLLRIRRHELFGAVKQPAPPIDLAAVFEEAWKDKDFDDVFLCWFTLAVAGSFMKADRLDDAARVLDRTAGWDFVTSRLATPWEDYHRRLTCYRGLVALARSGPDAARLVLAKARELTDLPILKDIAAADDAILRDELAKGAWGKGGVR